MSDDVRFDLNFAGVSRLLRSEMIADALMHRAEQVRACAEGIAPVGGDVSPDPHPSRYKDSFGTRLEINKDRARAVVFNSAPEAIFVEKGNSKIDARHVLMRALDILRRL